MTSRLHRTFILSVSTLALLVGPMVMPDIPLLSSAAVAGNGNGNGNGGDGGNGNGNGGGQGNSGGDQGNSGNSGSGNGSGNDGGNGNSRASRNATTETSGSVGTGKGQSRAKTGATEIASAEGDSPRERTRNLKAELAGLNSLKRNINGLMNSSDPRMDGIREFIVASVALSAAEDEAEAAKKAFLDAQGEYRDILSDYDLPNGTTPAMLREQIDAFVIPVDNPATPEDESEGADEALLEKERLEGALVALSAQWEVLVAASKTYEDEAEELAEAQEAAGPEAFDKALLEAANRNRKSNPDYLTDDIRKWASNVVDGLVDDYADQQN
jgi:hypothetical protein